VNQNCAEFMKFFALPNSWVENPKNCTHLMTRHVAVLCGYFFKPKVIAVNTLNFLPVSYRSNCKKKCWETSASGMVCNIKAWSFCGACKNFRTQHFLGAEAWFSDNV